MHMVMNGVMPTSEVRISEEANDGVTKCISPSGMCFVSYPLYLMDHSLAAQLVEASKHDVSTTVCNTCRGMCSHMHVLDKVYIVKLFWGQGHTCDVGSHGHRDAPMQHAAFVCAQCEFQCTTICAFMG